MDEPGAADSTTTPPGEDTSTNMEIDLTNDTKTGEEVVVVEDDDDDGLQTSSISPQPEAQGVSRDSTIKQICDNSLGNTSSTSVSREQQQEEEKEEEEEEEEEEQQQQQQQKQKQKQKQKTTTKTTKNNKKQYLATKRLTYHTNYFSLSSKQ